MDFSFSFFFFAWTLSHLISNRDFITFISCPRKQGLKILGVLLHREGSLEYILALTGSVFETLSCTPVPKDEYAPPPPHKFNIQPFLKIFLIQYRLVFSQKDLHKLLLQAIIYSSLLQLHMLIIICNLIKLIIFLLNTTKV